MTVSNPQVATKFLVVKETQDDSKAEKNSGQLLLVKKNSLAKAKQNHLSLLEQVEDFMALQWHQ